MWLISGGHRGSRRSDGWVRQIQTELASTAKSGVAWSILAVCWLIVGWLTVVAFLNLRDNAFSSSICSDRRVDVSHGLLKPDRVSNTTPRRDKQRRVSGTGCWTACCARARDIRIGVARFPSSSTNSGRGGRVPTMLLSRSSSTTLGSEGSRELSPPAHPPGGATGSGPHQVPLFVARARTSPPKPRRCRRR